MRKRRERNLYQREGVWWLRAVVNGAEHRESLHTRDVKIARSHRDRRLEEIQAARWHGKRRISFHDAVVSWAEHIAGQIAPSTAKRYAVSLLQAEPFLAPFDIDKVDGKAIADMIEARRKGGATPATVRRDLTAISSRVLEYSEARGWREGNPTLSKRRLLKERRDPIALPDPADVETMLAACSPRFGALVRAAWLTGCRQDELVRLSWRSINLRAGTAEIIGKGSKRRVIALSDVAQAHIEAQPRVPGRDLVFSREDGSAFIEAASDFVHFRRKLPAGARRFRFHDLRHLFAVEALRGGMGIYDLSKHLGHTSVKTTEIYLDFLTLDEVRSAKAATAQNQEQPKRFTGNESGLSI